MRESVVENYLIKSVKEVGGEVRKLCWIGRDSAPDRMVLLPMWHPMVELKRPSNKPTLKQRREHERLAKAGLTVFVIDTLSKVDFLIESWRHRTRV